MKQKLYLAVALVLVTLPANAECVCACVGGAVVPICESSIDLTPICAPRICPLVPPSIEPIAPLRLAPLGTTTCIQKQVYNEFTKQYEWQQICY